MGWVAYSFLTSDMFVLSANAPGVILSLWLNFGAVKLKYRETYEAASSILSNDDNILDSNLLDGSEQEMDVVEKVNIKSTTSHEIVTLSIILFWIIVFTALSFLSFTHEEKTLIIGIIVNINLIVFFAAPLSTIYTVLTTKNSASIHRPLMITNTFNAIFWSLYGLALWNFVIIIPNGCGVLFGVIQIILSCWFPRRDNGEAILRTVTYDKGDASTVTISSESYML